MKLDVPEFKRCCCCIPLRYGLLFLGYIKLISSFCLLGLVIFITITMANRIQRTTSKDYPLPKQLSYFIWEIIFIIFLTLITIFEILMNIVFIVGGHKKNSKLMKVFYYYNIVLLCLYIFAFSVLTTIEFMFQLPYVMRSDSFKMAAFFIEVKLGAGILNAVIQLYFILLIRSEVRKLENNSKFWFKNNAAEAECNMESLNGNIEPRTDENSERITKITVNEDNVDVIRNNNINREKDEKLKLNKYQLITNVDVE